MKYNYETRDFYCTAYLLAKGFSLHGHRKHAGMTTFEFEDTPALTSAVKEYYGFRASVNPITHGNAIRTLKSIIHENTHGTEQFHSQTRKAN